MARHVVLGMSRSVSILWGELIHFLVTAYCSTAISKNSNNCHCANMNSFGSSHSATANLWRLIPLCAPGLLQNYAARGRDYRTYFLSCLLKLLNLSGHLKKKLLTEIGIIHLKKFNFWIPGGMGLVGLTLTGVRRETGP